MKIIETNTYIIRKSDEPAYKEASQGKLEKDENGNLIAYSKDDVVDIISSLINSKELKKGDKIDKEKSKYIIFRFVYQKETKTGKIVKFAHRIKVSKEYYEDNYPYNERLEALVKSSHAIKTVNTAKIIALGLAVTLTLTGLTALALDASDKNAATRIEQNAKYVEELNNERRNNDVPPIGAVYEDGTAFNGSYQDWVKYISGYTDKDGNLIEEDGTPKTYQKTN